MIQDKPIFWHAIFVTKGVMKFSILWLSNVQPILFPPFIHIIPTAYGTSLWPMPLSYQILILNIENNFNNDFKCSAGLLISYDVCNIITWKWNHCMSSIIIFGQNYMLFWWINLFPIWRKFFLGIQFIFVCGCVQVKFSFLN